MTDFDNPTDTAEPEVLAETASSTAAEAPAEDASPADGNTPEESAAEEFADLRFFAASRSERINSLNSPPYWIYHKFMRLTTAY